MPTIPVWTLNPGGQALAWAAHVAATPTRHFDFTALAFATGTLAAANYRTLPPHPDPGLLGVNAEAFTTTDIAWPAGDYVVTIHPAADDGAGGTTYGSPVDLRALTIAGTGTGAGGSLTLSDVTAAARTALDNQGYTTGRAPLLDHLDADVSSVGGPGGGGGGSTSGPSTSDLPVGRGTVTGTPTAQVITITGVVLAGAVVSGMWASPTAPRYAYREATAERELIGNHAVTGTGETAQHALTLNMPFRSVPQPGETITIL